MQGSLPVPGGPSARSDQISDCPAAVALAYVNKSVTKLSRLPAGIILLTSGERLKDSRSHACAQDAAGRIKQIVPVLSSSSFADVDPDHFFSCNIGQRERSD
jgi:hypothetical protein